MNSAFDLHSHSTASDGVLSPTELVGMAFAAGVRMLALTDHDTTAGIEEAQEAADGRLQLLPGVEISVTWHGHTIHVIGLDVDIRNAALQQGLAGLRVFREWRAEEIGRRLLKQCKIEGAFEGAKALSNGHLVSRTHFARFLLGKGYARDMRSLFAKYLTEGKPGYVAGQWANLADAVGWICGAGGVAVLAHPARYNMTATKLRALMGEFKEAGGLALEVVSGSHSKDDIRNMARYAKDFALFASAGSDFHDPETPFIALGKLPDLPPGLSPVWSLWLDDRLRKSGG